MGEKNKEMVWVEKRNRDGNKVKYKMFDVA